MTRQRTGLPRVRQLHHDPVGLQLARDPPPAGRRLKRGRLELPVPQLKRKLQAFRRRLESGSGDCWYRKPV